MSGVFLVQLEGGGVGRYFSCRDLEITNVHFIINSKYDVLFALRNEISVDFDV